MGEAEPSISLVSSTGSAAFAPTVVELSEQAFESMVRLPGASG
ncbi:MAG TPA: hypothetical protein VIX84_02235 [Acidimicrobiales bacterium]